MPDLVVEFLMWEEFTGEFKKKWKKKVIKKEVLSNNDYSFMLLSIVTMLLHLQNSHLTHTIKNISK